LCKLDNEGSGAKEMPNLIHELFTNRSGNILAIGNLVLIAINASGTTASLGLTSLIRFSFLVNVPARLASLIVFGNSLVPNAAWQSRLSGYAFGTLIFVYLQWICIGWSARKISQAIQPKLN
jgi:hypothetical protein